MRNRRRRRRRNRRRNRLGGLRELIILVLLTSAAFIIGLKVVVPYLIESSRASPSASASSYVKVLYAIPSDMTYDARYEQAIRESVLDVQNWYGEQLDGVTFSISGELPQICNLEETTDMFEGAGGWDNMLDALQHCAPVAHFSKSFTWVVYVHIAVPCGEDGDTAPSFELGRGGDGVTILHGGDLKTFLDPTPSQPCPKWIWAEESKMKGGLAHELGHAFGLPHTAMCVNYPNFCRDQSVMWTGWWDYPDTFLLEEHKVFLSSLSFFETSQ